MTDNYLKSTDLAGLSTYCTSFDHVIGPKRGFAAFTDADGNVLPARGDPAYWYACIRAVGEVTPPAGVGICDENTGREVVGVWA